MLSQFAGRGDGGRVTSVSQAKRCGSASDSPDLLQPAMAPIRAGEGCLFRAGFLATRGAGTARRTRQIRRRVDEDECWVRQDRQDKAVDRA